jgi:hypothetical protein
MTTQLISRLALVLALLAALTATSAQAQRIFYVTTTGTAAPASANTPQASPSWANSTTDLQGAINAATTGDQVWVAAGLYKPTTFTGSASRNISFAMKNDVAIYGGFVGNETSLSQRLDVNPVICVPSSSTLSGEIGNGNNSLHVISNTLVGSSAVLDGFVVTGGIPSLNASGSGIYNNGGGPTIRHCQFTRFGSGPNTAHIYNDGSNPTFTNCAFGPAIQNTSGGGYMANLNSSPTLTNCSFGNSLGATSAAFFHNTGSTVRLFRCSFNTGTASGNGGFFVSSNSQLSLTNCQLGTGSVGGNGAMFFQTGTSSLTLINSTMGTGVSGNNGAMIYNEASGDLFLDNCSFGIGVSGSTGAMIHTSNGQLTARRCRFGTGTSGGSGGTIYSTGNSLQLTDCTFGAGTGGSLGGFIYNTASLTLVNCRFNQGSAPTGGGAIYNTGHNPLLVNCSFQKGTASQGSGGAIFNTGNQAQFIGCSFLDARSRDNGGTLYNAGTSPSLTNCSFQRGFTNTGSGAAVYTNSAATLTNCVAFDNQGSKAFSGTFVATYSLFDPVSATVAGMDISGPGNLTTATSPFINNGSNELAAGAPAINMGNSSATGLTGLVTDVAGNARFVGPSCQVDMGAYELQDNTGLRVITQPATGTTVCAGSPISTMLSLMGTATSYQWYKDDNPISGQMSATLSIPSATTTDIGDYYLQLTGLCNFSLNSGLFQVYVNPVPNPGLVHTGIITCGNPTVSLTATGGRSYSLRGGNSNQTGLFTVNRPDTYTVVVTNCNGCTATATTSVSSDGAIPNAQLTYLNGGRTVQVTGGISYQLVQPMVVINGVYQLRETFDSTNGFFELKRPGPFWVIVNGNGCTTRVDGSAP